MRRSLRVLMWAGIAVVGLALCVSIVAVWQVRRSFPSVRGQMPVAGLEGTVEILRDDVGVPHIWAESRHDLYFAQGYVHAQDRYWQMEFSRRLGAGRLSELLGPSTVDTDRFLRTMGFARVAAAEYAALEEPYRSYLDAYAAGVNAWIADRAPGRLGLEFTLLALGGTKVEIDPWTPVDSLTWGKIMAYDLGANLSDELNNIALVRFGGSALQAALRPPFRSGFPYIVTMDEVESSRVALGLDPLPQGPTASSYRSAERSKGSNSWVLAGSRTASGAPLLANDMHLGEQMPSIWYEVGLHLREPGTEGEATWTVRGYSFPGVPGVIAGQNDKIAWGLTNIGGDVQDTHVITVGSNDPNLYRVDDSWRAMDVRTEFIRVAGEEMPVEHRVRETVFGPVITDLPQYSSWFSYTMEPQTDAKVSVSELALEWPALRPESTVRAILDVDFASNYNEFRAAVSNWDSPGQNLVYADRDGNIAYQSTGSYPDRDVDAGQLPVVDRDSVEPDVRFDDLPFAFNPGKGFIVTANQPVVPPDYPYPLGEDFAAGKRADRIRELITALDHPADAQDIATIQGDVYSRAAAEIVAPLLRITPERAVASWEAYVATRLDADRLADSDHAKDADLVRRLTPRAFELLGDWDARMDAKSAAAAVYGFYYDALLRELLADEVPGGEWPVASETTGEEVVYDLLQRPDDPLWDDRTTPVREDAEAILGRSLVTGLLALVDKQGDRPSRWEWGRSHEITFTNQSLGVSGIGFIERIVNRGPFPLGGGPTTVSVAHWRVSEPFDVTSIPSERAIYDLSDPSRSLFVNTTGQSGHPFNRHYDDMIDAWREVRYHPSYWTYAEARKAAGTRRLVLTPDR